MTYFVVGSRSASCLHFGRGTHLCFFVFLRPFLVTIAKSLLNLSFGTLSNIVQQHVLQHKLTPDWKDQALMSPDIRKFRQTDGQLLLSVVKTESEVRFKSD